MKQEEIQQLSRDDLRALVLQLQAEVESLRRTIEELQTPPPPPPTAKNSSLPPSRDPKPNRSEGSRRRHGPPKGHPKYERPLVENPDHRVTVRPSQCPTCQTDLSGVIGAVVGVSQITEIPEPRAQVIEVHHIAVTCPHCGETHMKEPPQGLEPDRQVGSRLEALIVSYRQEQHRSYERTQEALHDLHGVHLSQGGIDQVMQRAGRAANEQMPRLQEQVASSAVINSDETSVRVKGQTWWHWVFGTAIAVVHRIQPSRAASVIEGVMGKHQAQVWGSDCLAAQLKAPAQQRHICLAHQIRDLPRLIDGAGCSWWAKSMQTVFRAALHLHHQRDTLPSDQFAVQVARLDRIVDWLLARSPPGGAALRLCRRYRKHRASLFVFLSRTDVDPTHNVSERAVRPSVIHTKVTGGFRSEWGAHAYASLCSVIDTAELQGTTAFAALQKLMGTPALPLPQL